MYLLDTNVVSELRKAAGNKADKKVVAWANSVPSAELFLSVITVLELEIGTLKMELRDNMQGALLRKWLNNYILPAFSDRILQIDTEVVLRCAKLHVPNKGKDRDALIAATALVHGLTVITRNAVDFQSTGVSIINPWS